MDTSTEFIWWGAKLMVLLVYIYAVAHIVFAAYFSQKATYTRTLVKSLEGGEEK